jgi:hypothetical protein
MLEILNGLTQFTLFLMGKFNLKVKQTACWNGLCSTFEGPLYLDIRGKILGKHSVRLKNGYTFQAACSLYSGRYSMVQKSLDIRSNNI